MSLRWLWKLPEIAASSQNVRSTCWALIIYKMYLDLVGKSSRFSMFFNMVWWCVKLLRRRTCRELVLQAQFCQVSQVVFVDILYLAGKVVLRKAMKSTGDGTSPKFDSAQHHKPHWNILPRPPPLQVASFAPSFTSLFALMRTTGYKSSVRSQNCCQHDTRLTSEVLIGSNLSWTQQLSGWAAELHFVPTISSSRCECFQWLLTGSDQTRTTSLWVQLLQILQSWSVLPAVPVHPILVNLIILVMTGLFGWFNSKGFASDRWSTPSSEWVIYTQRSEHRLFQVSHGWFEEINYPESKAQHRASPVSSWSKNQESHCPDLRLSFY